MAALDVIDNEGDIVILGGTFSSGNVSVTSNYDIRIYSSPENLPTMANLSYSSGGPAEPYFTLGNSSLEFLNMTIIFSSNNQDVFVSLTGFTYIYICLCIKEQ
jgi:hypothetical protein